MRNGTRWQKVIYSGTAVGLSLCMTASASAAASTEEQAVVEETECFTDFVPEEAALFTSGEEEALEQELFQDEVSEENVLLEAGQEEPMETSMSQKDIQKTYEKVGKQLAILAEQYVPTVNTVNGEWHILGLARGGQSVNQTVYAQYLQNVTNLLKETKGVLHERKYTEYSRVILALTALGENVTDVAGYNLLKPLADFDKTVWQGVNGAAFGLIAFDSHNYKIPEAEPGQSQTTREKLIGHMLDSQLSDGGWAISGRKSDPDTTGMVMAALAPYYQSNSEVKTAMDQAISMLSQKQSKDGTFSTMGNNTAESCAQVIVALSSLGIDAATDSRFIKKGHSLMDGLMTFYMDGVFSHVQKGEADQMATEQGYYALVAYSRFIKGENSLYDMTDVSLKGNPPQGEPENQEEENPGNTGSGEENSGNPESENNGTGDAKPGQDQSQDDRADQGEKEEEKDKNKDKNKEKNKKKQKEEQPQLGSRQPGGISKQVNLTSGGRSRSGFGGSAPGSRKEEATKKPVIVQEEVPEEASGESESKRKEDQKKGRKAADKITANTVRREISDLLYGGKQKEPLPEQAEDYTGEDLDTILKIYKDYQSLSQKKKQKVEFSREYGDFEKALETLGQHHHYDKASGIDLRNNTEEAFPWYVRLKVAPRLLKREELEKVAGTLGEDSEVLVFYEIGFENLLTEEDWIPEQLLRVNYPKADLGDYEQAVILHIRDDASMEFLEGEEAGEYLAFEASEFSGYGIAGMMGSMEERMTMTEETKEPPLWALGAIGSAAAGLLGVLMLRRKSLQRKGTGMEEET